MCQYRKLSNKFKGQGGSFQMIVFNLKQKSFFQQHETDVQQTIADTQTLSINSNNECHTFKQSSNNNSAPHKYTVSHGSNSTLIEQHNFLAFLSTQKFIIFLSVIFKISISLGVLAAIASFQRAIS